MTGDDLDGEPVAGDRLQRLIDRKAAYYQTRVRQQGLAVFPGAARLIMQAADAGLVLGLVSGKDRGKALGRQKRFKKAFKALPTAEDSRVFFDAQAMFVTVRSTVDLALTEAVKPEDLVLKPAFLDATQKVVEALAEDTADGGPALLVGAPWRGDDGGVYNAALLLDGGKIQSVRFKYDLPNYSVFDEKRVFKAGPLPGPVNFRGVRLGVMVCEDMWGPDVAECLEESGAEILLIPNGSPYEMDKADQRLQLAVARVTETGLPLIYVNQVGGQDELVFDGASFVLDAGCRLRAQLPSFEPGLTTTHWRRGHGDEHDVDLDRERQHGRDQRERHVRRELPRLRRLRRHGRQRPVGRGR